jgi:hypothetical protein
MCNKIIIGALIVAMVVFIYSLYAVKPNVDGFIRQSKMNTNLLRNLLSQMNESQILIESQSEKFAGENILDMIAFHRDKIDRIIRNNWAFELDLLARKNQIRGEEECGEIFQYIVNQEAQIALLMDENTRLIRRVKEIENSL